MSIRTKQRNATVAGGEFFFLLIIGSKADAITFLGSSQSKFS